MISTPTWLVELLAWRTRRWLTASAAAALSAIAVAVPTDLIDTPWFTREIPPPWWSWPVLIVNSLLIGLVVATYVAVRGGSRGRKRSWAGGVLTFFAIGCPVCNKLALLTLGYSGAIRFFQPIQDFLAIGSIILLGWVLIMRLSRAALCPLPRSSV